MGCRVREGGRPPVAAAAAIVVTLAVNQELTSHKHCWQLFANCDTLSRVATCTVPTCLLFRE